MESNNAIKFQAFLDKIVSPTTAVATLKNELNAGLLRISTGSYKSVRQAGQAKSTLLMNTAQPKDVSVCNLQNATPTNKQAMLVEKIIITGAIAAVPAGQRWEDVAAGLIFTNIKTLGTGGLENGTIRIKNGAEIYLQDFSLVNFTASNAANGKLDGEFTLKTPLFLAPSQEIEAEVYFGKPTPTDLFLKIEFVGPQTIAA